MLFASNDSVKTMKCIRPLVLTADIAFTENRFPVRRTTGTVLVGIHRAGFRRKAAVRRRVGHRPGRQVGLIHAGSGRGNPFRESPYGILISLPERAEMIGSAVDNLSAAPRSAMA